MTYTTEELRRRRNLAYRRVALLRRLASGAAYTARAARIWRALGRAYAEAGQRANAAYRADGRWVY